jgi:hypothetical protein
MIETLSEKRCRFTHDAALLVFQAEQLGFNVAYDEIKRRQVEADANAAAGIGIKNSLHLLGLAVDLMLYKDGVYLTETSDYEPLGVWWESLGEDHCWGGRFSKPDGDHFSITHNGVK